jgi:hypothetical protein
MATSVQILHLRHKARRDRFRHHTSSLILYRPVRRQHPHCGTCTSCCIVTREANLAATRDSFCNLKPVIFCSLDNELDHLGAQASLTLRACYCQTRHLLCSCDKALQPHRGHLILIYHVWLLFYWWRPATIRGRMALTDASATKYRDLARDMAPGCAREFY